MQENISHKSSRLLVEGEEDKSEVLPLGEGSLIIDEVKVYMTETTGTMILLCHFKGWYEVVME